MSKISEKLNKIASLIDDAMQVYLELDDETYPVLAEAMRYSASSGGKRIRPALTMLVSSMLGGKVEDALPLACAVEMVHTYSLIHDDLPCMDDDVERRGRPTNHVVYGEANALLAGDGLLTYAFETAVSGEIDPEGKVEAVRLLSSMAGPSGMVGGQVIDLIGDTETLDFETLCRMQRMKTGCLIRCAALLGMIAAGYSLGRDVELKTAIETYASGVGLAFQIEDDILDLGQEDGKTTFLTYLTVDQAREMVEALTNQAICAIAPYDKDGDLTDLARFLVDREK